MPEVVVSGISSGFPELSRCDGQIAHVLLTRSPLVYPQRGLTARLACVKHAASVRPEPGSNSPTKTGPKKSPACDGVTHQATSNWHNTTSPNTKLDTLLSSQKTPAHQPAAVRPRLGARVPIVRPTRTHSSRSARQETSGPGDRSPRGSFCPASRWQEQRYASRSRKVKSPPIVWFDLRIQVERPARAPLVRKRLRRAASIGGAD